MKLGTSIAAALLGVVISAHAHADGGAFDAANIDATTGDESTDSARSYATTAAEYGIPNERVYEVRTATRYPNRPMLWTGVTLLGISYGASAAVAVTSRRDVDSYLAAPVTGPWFDLANR